MSFASSVDGADAGRSPLLVAAAAADGGMNDAWATDAAMWVRSDLALSR